MIGDSAEDIRNSTVLTVIRDGIISFCITFLSVLIAEGFPRDPAIWLQHIYVPTLTAVMTFFISLSIHYGIRSKQR